jgi:hypothetical protein
MSSHTRFDFLTAPAYARCPNTAIRGWECLGWRKVLLWGGHHWLSPCWILPTWRIRLGHGSNLPQENVVRFLVQASNQASKQACMHATGRCLQLGLLGSSSTQSHETPPPLPPPQYPLEKLNKDTKHTHTTTTTTTTTTRSTLEHDRRYATMRNRKCSSSRKRFAHTCFFFYFLLFFFFFKIKKFFWLFLLDLDFSSFVVVVFF